MFDTSLRERTTLDQVRDRVHADNLGKWDLMAPRDGLIYRAGRLFCPYPDGHHRLEPTNWATGQLCSRLGIPAPYFRRCPPDLQETQVEYWLRRGEHREDEQWFLRCRDTTLRAVLSERYSPLDNAVLLDEVRRLLPHSYRVDWVGLSDEALHLRLVDPSRYREVLPDDSLTIGIHLSNSEVGYRSVRVDALVYRLVCTNGLIRLVQGKSLMCQRHLAIAETRFALALEEAIQGALVESERFLQQMQAATWTLVPDVPDAMERLAAHWRLGDKTQEAVQQALLAEPGSQQETLYGLINAFTSVARSLPDEQRYDLEVLAGQLAEHGVNAYAPKRRRADDDLVADTEPNVRNGSHLRLLPTRRPVPDAVVA